MLCGFIETIGIWKYHKEIRRSLGLTTAKQESQIWLTSVELEKKVVGEKVLYPIQL